MGGSPWGGSEELWCDVAHEAISRGFEVQVSVLDWGVYPPKLQDLSDKGVTISKRPVWQADKSLYKKILRKTASIINTKKAIRTLTSQHSTQISFLFHREELSIFVNSINCRKSS